MLKEVEQLKMLLMRLSNAEDSLNNVNISISEKR